MSYLWTYLMVGFLVAIIGQLILFINSKPSSLTGFTLDMVLWPVCVGMWLCKSWEE